MKKSSMPLWILFCAGLVSIMARPAGADDWPAFRGPQRDGMCRETGLLKEWPEGRSAVGLEDHRAGRGF